MRISTQAANTRNLDNLRARLAAYTTAQDRLGSGRRIRRSSDDPFGMSRALELRAQKRALEQHGRNADSGAAMINAADSKLQSVVQRLQRVRELAVTGASQNHPAAYDGMANEVASLRDDILGLANARYVGRGLFSGFAASDAVTNVGGTWTFTADDGAVTRRVGDDDVVRVNVTADEVFGFNAGQDVFSMLDTLESDLRAGDQAAVAASIGSLDEALDRVLNGLSILGSAGSRIEAARARIDDDMLAARSDLTNIEDVGFAEAVMELQLQEGAYQAALAAFARASQPSLIDFLG